MILARQRDTIIKGLNIFKNKVYDEAIEDFTKAIELNSKYAEAYCDRGNAYYSKGEYDKAIENYDKIIELYPLYISAYKNKGFALQKNGKEYEAQISFSKSVILDDDVEFKIYVQALSGTTFSMVLKTNYNCVLLDFMEIFSKIDYEKHTTEFIAFHKMDKTLREKIYNFVEVYENGNKSVQPIKFFSKHIPDNDLFIILRNVEKLTAEESNKIAFYLMEKAGIDINKIKDMFPTELNLYEMTNHQYVKKFSYGEMDKSRRICKYCGKRSPEVSFKNKAHIIPESLGNKALFDNEECDCCNAYFGKEIEPDLNKYLAPFKTLYNVKGKNGTTKIKNKDCFIKHSENGILQIGSNNREYDDKGILKKTTLPMGSMNMQNVYISFVKMALGFIPQNEVKKNFAETVDWIMKKTTKEKLPPVIRCFNVNGTVENFPTMVLYTRKNDTSKNLPYLVAKFQFKQLVFNYIIPFSKHDEIDFSDKDNFDKFHEKWHSFKTEYSLLDSSSQSEIVCFTINWTANNDISFTYDRMDTEG